MNQASKASLNDVCNAERSLLAKAAASSSAAMGNHPRVQIPSLSAKFSFLMSRAIGLVGPCE